MSVPTELLTPDNCTSPSRLRAFLRLSREATDDNIREHLNQLKGPAAYDEYFANTIIPQWNARSKVIQYCSDLAEQLRNSTVVTSPSKTAADPNTLSESFNLRTDPYALKNHTDILNRPFETCEAISNWTKNENFVESIVREETVRVLNDKAYYKDWFSVFEKSKK